LEYKIDFDEPFEYDGKKYESIDLSGINDLTGEDAINIDNAYRYNGGMPMPGMEQTAMYAFIVAGIVCDLEDTFFKKLNFRYATQIQSIVSMHFFSAKIRSRLARKLQEPASTSQEQPTPD